MNILQSVLGNLIITICEVAFVPEMLLQRKDARVALAELCRQVPDAQRPVSIEAREGLHYACWQ